MLRYMRLADYADRYQMLTSPFWDIRSLNLGATTKFLNKGAKFIITLLMPPIYGSLLFAIEI